MGVKDLRRRMILAPTPREAGAVVRHAALGPGFDGSGHGVGAGTGSLTPSSDGPPPSTRADPQR